MKNKFIWSAILAGILFFSAGITPVSAQFSADQEYIKNFHDSIIVQPSGIVDVTETIDYNFGNQQRHGIFRDIPLTNARGSKMLIFGVSVIDEQGKIYTFSESQSGGAIHIKIGDADKTITG